MEPTGQGWSRLSTRYSFFPWQPLPGGSGSLAPAGGEGRGEGAFLPQMFGWMNQDARELNMGGLRAITLMLPDED